MSRKLTDKQQQFVLEYLKDLNATQAAIRAGYSENTANVIGSENLSKPYIKEKIDEAMEKRSERVKIDADEVLKGILDIRDNAMQKAINEHSGINEMIDKSNALKASELLGKHLKLFTDVVEHGGSIDINTKAQLINKYLEE